MNEKLLASLGLAARELKVYRAIIKANTSTPAALSRMTGIKRTTAYSIARSLSEKGLLIEDSTKRPRTFAPASPKDIENLIAEERKSLSAREKTLKELSVELSRVSAEKTYPVPRIRFIEEGKLEQFLYIETSKWQKSLLERDGIWWGLQDRSFVDTFESWIDFTWTTKESKKEAYKVQIISNASDIEARLAKKYREARRDIRPLLGVDFTSTVWVTGDYFVMIVTQHHPHYLCEIHDATLAHNMRELCKKLWAETGTKFGSNFPSSS